MVNSGFGVNPQLPARKDAAPRTPSAVTRREAFARRHPEVIITPRRQDGRLIFEVSAPGSSAAAYDDANAMMNDLEARYP
jgi:hypothetical protein